MNASRTAWPWGLLALALAAATAAGVVLDRIEQASRRQRPEDVWQAPTGVGFVTVALGGFRGIAADLLWLRASTLQDEGRYVELSQLADWIAALEPHSTQVWAFHAWNMAYNISAMMADADDRWRWVRNGLRLLQQRGVAANGDDPAMYAEVGWMLLHKVGGLLEGDDSSDPWRWARELESLLPGGRLPAPGSESAQVAAARLRADYRMDLERMRAMDAAYGDLDWRSAYTHAAYWGLAGRDLAGERPDLPCERVLYQALIHAFFAGTPAADEAGLPAERPPLPRLVLLDGVLKALGDTKAAHPTDSGVREAERGFLEGAVLLLHVSGREVEAERLYTQRLAPAAAEGRPLPAFAALVSDVASVERLSPIARRAVLAAGLRQEPPVTGGASTFR